MRLLGCVQSQEYAHALWSLGMRTSGLKVTDAQAEFDRGDFLRTHILRPTWHFVAAEDIRWILEVTAPRVQKLNQTIYRQERLDPATLDRGLALIVEELEGGPVSNPGRARPSVGRPRPGWSAPWVGLHRHECRTRRRHLQRADARCSTDLCALGRARPRSADAGDAAELARRFFLGHGPASIQDLARWSSLTISQCRDAWRRSETAWTASLSRESSCGSTRMHRRSAVADALLLPLYDELTLSYPLINFPQATAIRMHRARICSLAL